MTDYKGWTTKDWDNDWFPAEQLDTEGDTRGMRWRGMEKMRYRKYLDVLEPELLADQSLKILDIGCALCDFTVRAWGLNKNNQFSCVDISENAIAWGSNNYPQFTFKVGTLPIIPFNEEFDMIFCLQVLCYLDANGRKEAIENMRNLLGPSGKVVFSGMIGDKDYHTEEEVVELFEQDFDMRHVSFNFWKLHVVGR